MVSREENIAKDFVMRLLKLVEVEYNFLRNYVKEICENFEALDCDSFPEGVFKDRLLAYTQKVCIAQTMSLEYSGTEMEMKW